MSECGRFGATDHSFVSASDLRHLFVLRKKAGDGTCFYASFAAGIAPSATTGELKRLATEVRLSAGNALCPGGKLAPHIVPAMIWSGEPKEYCRGLLSREGPPTWADELVNVAVAQQYEVKIVIFEQTHIPDTVTVKTIGDGRRCVFLMKTREHYDALIPISSDAKVIVPQESHPVPDVSPPVPPPVPPPPRHSARHSAGHSARHSARHPAPPPHPPTKKRHTTRDPVPVRLSQLCKYYSRAAAAGMQRDPRVLVRRKDFVRIGESTRK